jgi:YjbE family integral membrane protein
VVLRIIFTFFAAQLLQVRFVKFVGGLLILWIAVQLLTEKDRDPEKSQGAQGLWRAMWLILVADLTMSIDNILAIAGASRGDYRLIVFGLAVSIPFVVFSSDLLARLMDRFPALIYIGAGLLGKVGGDMILTDPFVVQRWNPTALFRYAVDAVLVLAVIVTGRLICRKNPTRAATSS